MRKYPLHVVPAWLMDYYRQWGIYSQLTNRLSTGPLKKERARAFGRPRAAALPSRPGPSHPTIPSRPSQPPELRLRSLLRSFLRISCFWSKKNKIRTESTESALKCIKAPTATHRADLLDEAPCRAVKVT